MDGTSAVAGGRRHAGRHNDIDGARYHARDTSKNPLNGIVLDNLLEFKELLKEPPSPMALPHPSIINALDKFSECGVMRYGAVRYLCPECGHDVFVAFSCKRRGVCPGCDAKRSAIITAAAQEPGALLRRAGAALAAAARAGRQS